MTYHRDNISDWHKRQEAAGRMAQHFEAMNERNRRWPAGWWILPMALIGAGMIAAGLWVWWL